MQWISIRDYKKNEIVELFLKYKHGNTFHKHVKHQNEWTT